MEIIVRKYEHYNTSFKNWNTPKGRYISSKSDYEKAMREEGMISSEQAAQNYKNPIKDYKLSKKAEDIIRTAKLKSKNGKLKLDMSDGLLNTMIDNGIIKKKGYGMAHLPSAYQKKGGFNG